MNDEKCDVFTLYRSMRRIRRVEEKLIAEYHPADEMRCPIHFCVGQEATPAALGLALHKADSIYSHYRSHGYFLAKGGSLNAMVAEFYGKKSGSNKGMAGSMELADPAIHFHSGAIVGGTAGLAVGHAFAYKFLEQNYIAVAVFGDGAMDEGVNYEAINLAVIHELPVLFICENNGYAAHTPLKLRTRSSSLHERARAFGIRAIALHDNDPVQLSAQLGAIVSDVRSHKHPVFVEVDTYRFCSHVGPEDEDWMGYRPKHEIAARHAADPVLFLRQKLLSNASPDALDHVDQDIDREIANAIDEAKGAPFPNSAWSRSIVLSGEYDPVVPGFRDDVITDFHGAQREARLGPY